MTTGAAARVEALIELRRYQEAAAVGVQLFLLAAIVVFGRYSRLWLRRRGWISF